MTLAELRPLPTRSSRHMWRDMTDDRATGVAEPKDAPKPPEPKPMPKEIGGPPGLEPTRYGDWEVNGRCSDF